MKKFVFLTVMAGIFAFTACNTAKQDTVAEESEIQLVANPDFVFSSGGTTLFSTFATKADTDAQTEVEVKDENVNVEVNLSVCPVGGREITASKLSVHVRTATDVTVFLPVEASAYSVAVFKETQTPGRTGGYGVNSAIWHIDGNPVTATAEFDEEKGGITVTVEGVTEAVAKYLYDGYKDGLTVEVWNYYNDDVTMDGLKASFDAGATVSFTAQPDVYVNAFAKIPNYIDGVESDELPRIYTKIDDNGFLFPFLDEALTKPLDDEFWVRPAENDVEDGVCPSRFYLLKGHKNPYDCIVTPKDLTIFSKVTTHKADVPEDAAQVVHVIDKDYNVVYTK